MFLHEIKFILPENDDQGNSGEDVHNSLEAILTRDFGSFIITPSELVEMNELVNEAVRKEVLVYEILIPNKKILIDKLKVIVRKFAGDLGQKEVFFKLANGEVYLINVD